ncbi:MAG: hypothetical protein DRI61_12560 [Chloroflexi bacterium]|nr:MAG: hypothetical protein DRI61_12560 [Chloroflexota bacterium]
MRRLVRAVRKLRDLSEAKKEVASGTFRRYAYRGSWALCTAVGCRFWKGRCMLDFARKVVRGDYKVSEEEKAWARKFLDEGTDGCPLDQI